MIGEIWPKIYLYLSCYNMIYRCNLWDLEPFIFFRIFFIIISNDFQNVQLDLQKSKRSWSSINDVSGMLDSFITLKDLLRIEVHNTWLFLWGGSHQYRTAQASLDVTSESLDL